MPENNTIIYYKDAKIICACGNKMTVGSTVKEMHIEICSNCHPFYTGKQRIVDTTGSVERFKARLKKTKKLQDKKQLSTKSRSK